MRLSAVEVGREQVGPEPRERRMDGLGARLEQFDDGGIETDGDRPIDLEDEPGTAGWAAPSFAGAVAVPRAVHPQVGPQLEAAVEPDQQVLALRLDRVDPLPDDPLDLRDGSRTLGPCSHDVTTNEVRAEALLRSGKACHLRARPEPSALGAASGRGNRR